MVSVVPQGPDRLAACLALASLHPFLTVISGLTALRALPRCLNQPHRASPPRIQTMLTSCFSDPGQLWW